MRRISLAHLPETGADGSAFGRNATLLRDFSFAQGTVRFLASQPVAVTASEPALAGGKLAFPRIQHRSRRLVRRASAEI